MTFDKEEDKSAEFSIQLQANEEWEDMALSLMRHGYKVSLSQDWRELRCKRAWVYAKKREDTA